MKRRDFALALAGALAGGGALARALPAPRLMPVAASPAVLRFLAAVPGCILAQRYYNHDQGPYSLACYDLVAEQVLGSPPWLAVRGTPWSDIVRPHFTNTRRTMFRALA